MAFSIYHQSSGRFAIFDFDENGNERELAEFVGYAGRGIHKNRPENDHEKNLGPLPRGLYFVGDSFDHPRLGKLAYRLRPHLKNRMYGRSGFLIHGDSRDAPGDASRGCIILSRQAREAILIFGVRSVEVVPGVEHPEPSA